MTYTLETKGSKGATERPTQKLLICPLLSITNSILASQVPPNTTDNKRKLAMCLKERCALWVVGNKQSLTINGYLHYEGCGLIPNIFWEQPKKGGDKQP